MNIKFEILKLESIVNGDNYEGAPCYYFCMQPFLKLAILCQANSRSFSSVTVTRRLNLFNF